jgi:exo-beta-1,3-glucanase (GH17 family)
LLAALKQLAREGWRGIVTYSLDRSLELVPRLARRAGFQKVIAGLFWFDDAQLQRERAAALRQLHWIDGFVLGNEGLDAGRYSRTRLEQEIARLKSDTRRPVATSEPQSRYTADPSLTQVGDWVFPNAQPWFAGIRSVPEAVQFVQDQMAEIAASAPGRVVVAKEAWWPTGGGTGASNRAQVEFFQGLVHSGVKFVFGEAYDEFWKTDEGPQGPHWGFHTASRKPKPAIGALRSIYTGRY